MILFKNHDPRTNAINSIKVAFEIMEQNRIIGRFFPDDMSLIPVNIGINSGSALLGMTRPGECFPHSSCIYFSCLLNCVTLEIYYDNHISIP